MPCAMLIGWTGFSRSRVCSHHNAELTVPRRTRSAEETWGAGATAAREASRLPLHYMRLHYMRRGTCETWWR